MDNSILLYNRETKAIETECVYKQKFMEWLYTTSTGLLAEKLFFSRKIFSKAYGKQHDNSRKALKQIQAFVDKYNVNLNDCEKPLQEYHSFNDFFARKLKPECRTIDPEKRNLISPVDGRLLYYNLQKQTLFPVKGRTFDLSAFLEDSNLANTFHNGSCLIFRLAPVDYHRIHYIDSGQQGAVKRCGRRLHSVSPLSIKAGFPIFLENVRDICSLFTDNFGEVLHIDVGALAVGRIKQNLAKGGPIVRGQEKGLFQFGGSTVVLVFKQGVLDIDSDIQQKSSEGIETLIKLGERIGTKLDPHN